MQTNVEQTSAQQAAPSALERRVDLSIAIADIDREVDARLKRIGRNVKMAGFRPGKVPAHIVRQQHGDQARHEALNEALDQAFVEAVTAGQMRVAGYPRIEPKSTESATHLEFAAVFEVYPEVKLGDMTACVIERPTLEVGEAEIEKTIDILRKQRTRYEVVDRAAAREDRVVVDFLGKKDGEPFQGGQASDYPFVIGQNSVLADFENAAEGLKAGETKSFDMTFPDDYFAKELAGQKVQFEITVKKVSAPVLPELDAEFAKSLGIADGDLARMREEITGNLEREVKKRLQAKIKDQVMDAILEASPIELPNALIEMEIHRLMEDARRDMEQRGMKNVRDLPIEPQWFAEQARRRVSLGLVLAELVKARELHARPEQVKAIVDEAAQSYEHPEEVVRWYYAQPQRLKDVEAVAIENNVVAWVLATARVEDKPIAFDELMGEKQA